ncbi:MAG: hypothetical protein RL092_707 [Bacteroidota bacterium]|jgi:hypothetical protein
MKFSQSLKTTSILIVAFTSLFIYTSTSCNLVQSPEDKLKAAQDSIKYAEIAAAKIDSLKSKLNREFAEKDAELILTNIEIINCSTETPNSAGGVNGNIIWKNLSDKTVKYITFCVAPYNAVDDIVQSQIGNESYKFLNVTGPVKSGEISGKGSIWENIWYNSTIKYMKINGLKIEYLDGTIYSTNKKEIIENITIKR